MITTSEKKNGRPRTCGACRHPKNKCKCGRKNTKTDPETGLFDPVLLGKLEGAFSYGLSNEMACFVAGISPGHFYEIVKKSPELHERFKILKKSPKIAAIKNVVDEIKKGGTDASKWYLERKMPGQFSGKGKGGNPNPAMNPESQLTKEEQKELKLALDETGIE